MSTTVVLMSSTHSSSLWAIRRWSLSLARRRLELVGGRRPPHPGPPGAAKRLPDVGGSLPSGSMKMSDQPRSQPQRLRRCQGGLHRGQLSQRQRDGTHRDGGAPAPPPRVAPAQRPEYSLSWCSLLGSLRWTTHHPRQIDCVHCACPKPYNEWDTRTNLSILRSVNGGPASPRQSGEHTAVTRSRIASLCRRQ